MSETIVAGLVGFGEVNIPREIIERKCNDARRLLEQIGLKLVWTDPVSDDPSGTEATRAIQELNHNDFDLLIACVAGWIPSHTVVRVLDHFRDTPILLLGLTGYFENGRLVTTADQAGTAALRKPLVDMGFVLKYLYLRVDSPPPTSEILAFATAAHAARMLRQSHIGSMGYRDMNLYGTLHDGVSLRSQIGPEVEVFDVLQVQTASQEYDRQMTAAILEANVSEWHFEKNPKEETLEKGIRYYLALNDIVESRKYDAITLIDVDGMKKLLDFPPAMIFTLLGERNRIPTVPENDIPGAVTQLIVRYLTGQIAPYLEIYEFFEDRILFGVPDYIPSEVVEGQVTMTVTRFGGLSEGILNVSKMKTGPVTICRLTNTGNRYQMHCVTGTAYEPRNWQEAGWTPPAPQLPSVEISPEGGVADFAQKVLSQHYIVAYGNHADAVRDLCRLLQIEMI